MKLSEGQPCDRHANCLSHISHPCEGCARIGGVSLPHIWGNYFTQLEAENKALLQFATLFYGMGADKWPEGAYEYYQAMPNEVAQKMDALLTGEEKEWVHPMTMGEGVDAEETDGC